jgi:hypothetical protein
LDVAEIAWGAWQVKHITRRHGVSSKDFDTAWHDPERKDLAEQLHEEHGPYYLSIGCAALGKPLKMVWRWQAQGSTVWPITAFFPERRRKRRR